MTRHASAAGRALASAATVLVAGYAAYKATGLALRSHIPGRPLEGLTWRQWIEWAVLGRNDWTWVLLGGGAAAVLSSPFLGRLNVAGLAFWAANVGAMLSLMEIFDWVDAVGPLVAVPPMALGWLIGRWPWARRDGPRRREVSAALPRR
jgi:hypothetical protein